MMDVGIITIGVCVVCAVVIISLFIALGYDSNTRSMPNNDDEIKHDDSEKED